MGITVEAPNGLDGHIYSKELLLLGFVTVDFKPGIKMNFWLKILLKYNHKQRRSSKIRQCCWTSRVQKRMFNRQYWFIESKAFTMITKSAFYSRSPKERSWPTIVTKNLCSTENRVKNTHFNHKQTHSTPDQQNKDHRPQDHRKQRNPTMHLI